MKKVQQLLQQRRVSRWRRCRKLRYLTETQISALEQQRHEEASFGWDVAALDRRLRHLNDRLTNITNTIERLERKERKRVSA